jgi:L-threonylcarbamoyladenylate synthase
VPDAPPPGSILPPTPDAIATAARILRAGGLVGMPTETVYGLAGDATNGEAVAAIFEAKGRPQFNPLISHVASVEEARQHGVFNRDADRLAAAFWPGPLTIVVPRRRGSGICDLARAGLDTVALRVPAHPLALALIRAASRPLAAPSANLSGRISPTTAADVQADLGPKVAVILDGGPCGVGLESTVAACLDGSVALLRPGGAPRDAIASVIGRPLESPGAAERPSSPGMLLSHYAPIAPVHLNVLKPGPNDAILTFGSSKFVDRDANRAVINLSPQGDLRQAAARLFAALRELDALNPPVISVTPIPHEGLGEAINDRLARAAAPRPGAELG